MKSVLVTGARRGIGLATAVEFAKHGWRVFAGMRGPGDSADLADAAEVAGVNVVVVDLDVTNPSGVAAAIDLVVGDAGRLDVVVNNAALIPMGPAEDCGSQGWADTFATNVVGVAHVTMAALPTMREQGSGRVVNISSLAARNMTGPPVSAAYNTSKAAVGSMAYHWNKELVPLGIRMQTIELGPWDTPGVKEISEQLAEVPADSPYRVATDRMLGFMEGMNSSLGSPEVAAAGIFEIATSNDARVSFVLPREWERRAPIGDRLTDAEFLELCAITTPAEYFARLSELLTQQG